MSAQVLKWNLKMGSNPGVERKTGDAEEVSRGGPGYTGDNSVDATG